MAAAHGARLEPLGKLTVGNLDFRLALSAAAMMEALFAGETEAFRAPSIPARVPNMEGIRAPSIPTRAPNIEGLRAPSIPARAHALRTERAN